MFCYVDKLSCFVIIGYDMLIQRMHKKWHIIWNFGKNCILSRAFFFYRNQDNTPSYINIAQKSMFYCVLSLVCMHIFHFTLCTVTQWVFVTFNWTLEHHCRKWFEKSMQFRIKVNLFSHKTTRSYCLKGNPETSENVETTKQELCKIRPRKSGYFLAKCQRICHFAWKKNKALAFPCQ